MLLWASCYKKFKICTCLIVKWSRPEHSGACWGCVRFYPKVAVRDRGLCICRAKT